MYTIKYTHLYKKFFIIWINDGHEMKQEALFKKQKSHTIYIYKDIFLARAVCAFSVHTELQ